MKVAFGVREGPYKKSCQTWSLDLYIVVLLLTFHIGLIDDPRVVPFMKPKPGDPVPSHARVIEVRTA